MAKWSFLPWRQSSASKYRPDTLNFGCISTSKSGEFSVGDANNKAVPVMPVGCVIPFAGAAAPTGWLLCQGQAVSRTTYAQLFSVIGTTYGSGDGSTTFNLPDMRGRVAVGSDANLGTISGEKTHVQTANEIANHGHGLRVNPPLNLEIENTYAGQYLRAAALKANAWGASADIYNNYADATGVIVSGESIAMSLMQPSLHLNQIIKI